MAPLPLIPSLVGGEEAAAGGGPRAPVFDPATGRGTAETEAAGPDLVGAAVAAARAALPEWAALPSLRRSRVLRRWLGLLDARRDDLARLISAENGKTAADARAEAARGIEVVEFACGLPAATARRFSRAAGTGIDVFEARHPLGVAAAITPFNFPLMVPMWTAPIALATGNCLIVKPSERVPSASLLAARLALEAGVPPGAFQVLQGGRATAEALAGHPGVDSVSFVGSSPAARAVYAAAAAAGKRVQALGGAKNHAVVLPDADLDAAADGIAGAAWGAAGQRCMAVSVAVPVGRGTAERLVEALAARGRALKVGPASDPDSGMGPLITAERRDEVAAAAGAAVDAGAEPVLDGRGFRAPQGFEGGFFLGPCLLDRVEPGSDIWREEVFGPVLSVARAGSAAEALGIVNSHPKGNGASVFTRDGGAARAFAEGVEAGMVGVNVPIPVPVAWHSFGGWKESMLGGHAMHGREGLLFHTRLKTTTARWPAPAGWDGSGGDAGGPPGAPAAGPSGGGGADLGMPTLG